MSIALSLVSGLSGSLRAIHRRRSGFNMATLTITKAYSAGNALMEAHIDHFRNGLHELFNVTKFDSNNFDAGMELASSKFSGTNVVDNDDDGIDFGTGQDAFLGLDNLKNFVFDTAA